MTTDKEKLAAAQALDRAYAEAEAFDAAHAPSHTPSDDDADQMSELRKAGLNHRGQP